MADEEEKPPVPRRLWAPILLVVGLAVIAFGVKDYMVESEPASHPQSPFESAHTDLGIRQSSTARAELEIALGAFLTLAGGGLFLFRPRIETEEDEE